MSDMPSGVDPIEPRFFGRFLVIGEIGRGGYGVVFLAHDPQLNRDIALKVPHVSIVSVPGLRARFNQEARAAAGLDHPNIVQVFEAGDIGPICFIASAYCPGPNLADWLGQRKELVPYSDAAQLIAMLADAVNHAHHRGVFHRDLKPANIILHPASTTGNATRLSEFIPRITDFGLAKVVNDSSFNTQSGSVLGTPSYMAPEQAAGKASNTHGVADVYSLGAILYQLLTGVAPFQGDSPLETLQHVLTREPIAPSRLRQSLPKDLETICMKCLEKDPKERFQSAEELAEDLRRYLRSEPIRARPISTMEWLWRMARRKPLTASLTAALVVSIILGMLSVSILWQRSEYQRGRVTQALDRVSRANIEVMQRNEHSARMLYLRDIASAKAESAHNVEHSIQILENCQTDLRKWEWNYLNQVCGADMFTMHGQTIPAWNCKFTKDGKRIVIGCGMWNEKVPGEILAWDFESGQLVRKIQDFKGGVMDIAVHPNGRWIAAAEITWGTDNGGIQIVDLETGTHLRKLRECVTPFGVAANCIFGMCESNVS
jgi:serine/threonine protein kinase